MRSASKYTILLPFVLAITFSLLSSCSMLQQRGRNPECKTLFEQIENGWARDSATGLYRLTAKALAGHRFGYFKEDECLLGLAPKDIERLFGRPDTMYTDRMEYYMSEPCLEKKGARANACYYMACDFDDDGGLKRIGFVHTKVYINYLDTVPVPDKGK